MTKSKRRPTHPVVMLMEEYDRPDLIFTEVDSRIASKLSKELGTSRELWLNLQKSYDTWKKDNEKQTQIEKK